MPPISAVEAFANARSELAGAILAISADMDQTDGLMTGQIPDDLERKVLAYAAAKLSAARWIGHPRSIDAWEASYRGFAAREGRPPTIRELGEERGKSKTAAHRAILTLRALGRLPAVAG